MFYRLEASKDDYRIRCEELEKEIAELRQQNEDLTTLADEAQSLKDEMDVLRYITISYLHNILSCITVYHIHLKC